MNQQSFRQLRVKASGGIFHLFCFLKKDTEVVTSQQGSSAYIVKQSAYVNFVGHQTAVPGDGHRELVVTARRLTGHEVQLKDVTKTKETKI